MLCYDAPVVTNGVEAWTVNKKLMGNVETVEIKCNTS